MRGLILSCLLLASAGCQQESSIPKDAPSGQGARIDGIGAGLSGSKVDEASEPGARRKPEDFSGWLDSRIDPGQTAKYAPRDQCGSLPGARQFRLELAAAAWNRDIDALIGLAAPDVKLGFGGDDGAKRLREMLESGESDIWRELTELLSLGCATDAGGAMVIPWYFAQEFEGDPFESMLVADSGVPLFETAQKSAPVVRRLAWEFVTLADTQPLAGDGAFAAVRTSDGVSGFAPRKSLRSPVDYRLIAERLGGKWRITALLAGD